MLNIFGIDIEWIFLGICAVFFIIFELPGIICTIRGTKEENDNVKRNFWDYM